MKKITRRSPFRELLDARDDFDRIVDGIFKPETGLWQEYAKVPAVDVHDEKDSVVVKVEMQGLKKEEKKREMKVNVQ